MIKHFVLVGLVVSFHLPWCSLASSSVASLTTLPPASPTGNDSCDFTDRVSLLNRIESDLQEYNISLLVETCSTICPLMYGSGNPDISGIGAMISYGIQGVLAFIFGPLLAILVHVFRYHTNPPERHIVKSMANISKTVYQANLFLAFATSVASVIRVTKVPPLAELTFIKGLAGYQLYIIFGLGYCQLYILGITSRRDTCMTFYSSIVLILYSVILLLNGYPSSKALILQQITEFCLVERDYALSTGNAIPKTQKANRAITVSELIYVGALVTSVILAALIWRYWSGPIKWFWQEVEKAFTKFCTFLRTTPRRFLTIFIVTIASAFWLAVSVVILRLLQVERNDLQLSTGSAYQDAEWGFGQVTVVILWLPLINDIVIEGYELYNPEDSEAVQQSSSEIELRPIQIQTQHISTAPSSPAQIIRAIDQIQSTDIAVSGLARQSSDTLLESDNDENEIASAPAQSIPEVLGQHSPQISPLATGFQSARPSQLARLTSNDVDGNSEFGLMQRTTWPRNESGTYLPTRRTG